MYAGRIVEKCDNIEDAIGMKAIEMFVEWEASSAEWHHTFLSNFWEGNPFRWNGMTWRTSEAAYQASKAVDLSEMFAIKMAPNPGRAKWLGMRCKIVPDWNTKKDGVMEAVLRSKFAVTELCDALLATGDAYLQEGNWWHDAHFGRELVDGIWVGENVLGKLLMKLRSEYMEASNGKP